MKKVTVAEIVLFLEELESSEETILLEFKRISKVFSDLKDIYDSTTVQGVSYDSIFVGNTNIKRDTFDVIVSNAKQYQEYLITQANNMISMKGVIDDYSRLNTCFSVLSTVRKTHYIILHRIYIDKTKRDAILAELDFNSKTTLTKYREEALIYMRNLFNLDCSNKELFDYARANLSEWMEDK